MTKAGHFAIALLLSALVALLAGCVAPEAAPASGSVRLPTVTPVEATTDEPEAEAIALPTVTPTAANAIAGAVVDESPQAVVISAVTAAQQAILDRLSQRTPAPELTNEVWINSEPLQLADLRGQVVIVEFWTYG